jgi:hypothetical protein
MSGPAQADASRDAGSAMVVASAAVQEQTLRTFYLAYTEDVFKKCVEVVLAQPAPWAIIPCTHILCRDPVVAIKAAKLKAGQSPSKKPRIEGPAVQSYYLLRLRLHEDDVEPIEAGEYGSKLARPAQPLTDSQSADVAEASAELCAATLGEISLFPRPAWRPLADLARELRQVEIEAKRRDLQRQLRDARDVEDKAKKDVAKIVRQLETL